MNLLVKIFTLKTCFKIKTQCTLNFVKNLLVDFFEKDAQGRVWRVEQLFYALHDSAYFFQCSRELGGFFLMFLIVFFAFDILAYVWFGALVIFFVYLRPYM